MLGANSRVAVLVAGAAAAALTGCVGGTRGASSIDERVAFVEDATVRVDAEDYAWVFERARDALRDAGFEIERVDAAAGVITTAPMPGLAAWKSGLLREAGVARVFHAEGWHATTVEARAVFAPTGDRVEDLRESGSALTLRFEVVERREHRPSRRIDTTSVVYASEFSDRGFSRQGMEPSFTVAGSRNHRAEALLSQRVVGSR
jgi:hypothetical protein